MYLYNPRMKNGRSKSPLKLCPWVPTPGRLSSLPGTDLVKTGQPALGLPRGRNRDRRQGVIGDGHGGALNDQGLLYRMGSRLAAAPTAGRFAAAPAVTGRCRLTAAPGVSGRLARP
ncbi:MAG: hypothetical protein L0332_36340, partial [Chloroflexi bacterium]|nr:hypothetical protein [Chloroflexota bacterium]MCI0648060.1 hypothetical protein [Chloroflexota bacterium]MCI0732167.1 hypothetical protein [Chloroflexota bacterium]